MRLTRWQRLTLMILGLALLGAGGVGAALNWSGVALTTFIIAGVFVVLGAVIGAMPKGSFKEGNVEWPDVDKHPRVEKIEADIAALRKEVEAEVTALRSEVDTAREEAMYAKDLLTDYVLVQEPEPDDGMTSEERLQELESRLQSIQSEISGRLFASENGDADIDMTDLAEAHDRSSKALAREERRQAARARFGLTTNTDQEESRRA